MQTEKNLLKDIVAPGISGSSVVWDHTSHTWGLLWWKHHDDCCCMHDGWGQMTKLHLCPWRPRCSIIVLSRKTTFSLCGHLLMLSPSLIRVYLIGRLQGLASSYKVSGNVFSRFYLRKAGITMWNMTRSLEGCSKMLCSHKWQKSPTVFTS